MDTCRGKFRLPQNRGIASFIGLTHYGSSTAKSKSKKSLMKSKVDFTKIDPSLLPTVIIVGRPNVGKIALFNRLIRRREALVYNTPDDHVTRDIREGIAKLGDLRFKVLDSAGLETEATSGTILNRTTEMTGNVLAKTQLAIFLMDVWDGLQPLDKDVGKWMRKHAARVHTIVAMNKSKSLDEEGLVAAAAGEAHSLGFGDPVAMSAETGLEMAELYATILPFLEDSCREERRRCSSSLAARALEVQVGGGASADWRRRCLEVERVCIAEFYPNSRMVVCA